MMNWKGRGRRDWGNHKLQSQEPISGMRYKPWISHLRSSNFNHSTRTYDGGEWCDLYGNVHKTDEYLVPYEA